MSQFKSVDTHGAGPPIQVPADSKPTRGPVTVCHTLVSNEVRGFSITAAPHGSCDPICASDFRSERSSSEIEANALLIKEAFDTADETGLTPQQLRDALAFERRWRAEDNVKLIAIIKQRDELLAAAKLFNTAAHDARDALNARGIACPASIALAAEKARAAISRAEGRS